MTADEAIELAASHDNLIDALAYIVEWEGDRLLNQFLTTSNRDNHFKQMMSLVLERYAVKSLSSNSKG